jgi:2-hydroxy-6-oxonona-2,4-dienedioate hydrolase
MSVFVSSKAREKLVGWHERFRLKIGIPTESVRLKTRLGETHALVGGPRNAPAIVCIHGAMASSAHILVGAAGLMKYFRLIAPDVPGQSPMSAEVRPDANTPAYAEWLSDVFDIFELDEARVFGTSWGGLIALRGAALMPRRILKMSLFVPAGIVQGPLLPAFLKLGWPMMRYKASPSPEQRYQYLRNLITTRDDDWETYLGDATLGFKLDARPPRLVKEGELYALKAPVQVLGAEWDLQSPGRKLIERARKVIPNLTNAEVIPRCHHVPPFDATFQNWLTDRLLTFFLDTQQLGTTEIGDHT